MAYDSQRHKTVLFGGLVLVWNQLQGDTWEWNGASWAQVASGGPWQRYAAAMAYDNVRGRSVMFGGAFGGALADTWEWTGSPGSASLFGQGCGSPPLALSPTANPTINTVATVTLSNIPSVVAFVALGWSRTSFGPFTLPLTLVTYGMPGCDLLQSAEAAAQPVTFTGASTATHSLPLPNWSGLVGLRVYLQGWAYAPGTNQGNTIVSNGIEWTIGF
jgi:hypothetical protein